MQCKLSDMQAKADRIVLVSNSSTQRLQTFVNIVPAPSAEYPHRTARKEHRIIFDGRALLRPYAPKWSEKDKKENACLILLTPIYSILLGSMVK